jgi:hypothetical protein
MHMYHNMDHTNDFNRTGENCPSLRLQLLGGRLPLIRGAGKSTPGRAHGMQYR